MASEPSASNVVGKRTSFTVKPVIQLGGAIVKVGPCRYELDNRQLPVAVVSYNWLQLVYREICQYSTAIEELAIKSRYETPAVPILSRPRVQRRTTIVFQ